MYGRTTCVDVQGECGAPGQSGQGKPAAKCKEESGSARKDRKVQSSGRSSGRISHFPSAPLIAWFDFVSCLCFANSARNPGLICTIGQGGGHHQKGLVKAGNCVVRRVCESVSDFFLKFKTLSCNIDASRYFGTSEVCSWCLPNICSDYVQRGPSLRTVSHCGQDGPLILHNWFPSCLHNWPILDLQFKYSVIKRLFSSASFFQFFNSDS